MMKSFILLSLFGILSMVSSYPFQAGHCDSGAMPSTSPHNGGQYTLIDTTTVYDILIGNQKLQLGETMNLAAGVKYKVTIERKTGSFKGLLFRLPLEYVFTLNKNDENLKLNPLCEDNDDNTIQSAITHSNGLEKTKAEFYMKIPDEGEYKLDVTFVLQKLGASEWADYTLNVSSLPSYCADSPLRMKQGKIKRESQLSAYANGLM